MHNKCQCPSPFPPPPQIIEKPMDLLLLRDLVAIRHAPPPPVPTSSDRANQSIGAAVERDSVQKCVWNVKSISGCHKTGGAIFCVLFTSRISSSSCCVCPLGVIACGNGGGKDGHTVTDWHSFMNSSPSTRDEWEFGRCCGIEVLEDSASYQVRPLTSFRVGMWTVWGSSWQ